MTLSPSEKLVAFLIAPDAAPAPSPESMPDPNDFLELLEEQKVPLKEVIAVNDLADHEIVGADCVQHALKADLARHRLLLEEFTTLRERLDESGIRHVMVKGVWGFPYRSENMDILIGADDVPRAVEILDDLGYLYNRFRPERFKRLHNRLSGSSLSGVVHLHKAISWYTPFVEPGIIFRSAVDGSEAGVRLPRREISMAINGVHALYEDATVRLIELHKIRYLIRSGPVDWDWLWNFAVHRGFESGLSLVFLILDRQHRTLTGQPLFDEPLLRRMESHLSLVDGTRQHYRRRVKGRELPTIYTMSKYFVRRCMFREVKRSGLMRFWRKIETTVLILRGGVHQVTCWYPQPPALIAVCGPDGCGKTTAIERAAAGLEAFEIRSRRSWIRIGDSFLLNWAKSPFQRRLKAEVDAGEASEQGVFKNRVIRAIWPVVAVADYLIRQYAAYIWIVFQERMVIADRYHVDALVDLALRCGPQIMRKHWVASAMRLLPKAYAVFVLKVSDETMRRRRRGDYIEGITHRVSAYYDEAATLMGGRVLSGEDDPEAIAETITKETLARFFERV